MTYLLRAFTESFIKFVKTLSKMHAKMYYLYFFSEDDVNQTLNFDFLNFNGIIICL